MGNYSQLYFTNAKEPPGQGELSEESPYLLSKYHVPILWLALFEPKDILEVPTESGEDIEPYLVRDRQEALALLESRKQWLLNNFKNLDPRWQDQFQSVLQKANFSYVQVDSSEVGSMTGTGEEWKSTLEKILGVFLETKPDDVKLGLFERLFAKPKPPSSWDVFNRTLGSAYKGSQGTEPWPYCGASGTDESMPWEDDL